MSQTDFDPVST